MKYIVYTLLLVSVTLRAAGQTGFQVEPPKLTFDKQNGKLAPLRVKLTNTSAVGMVIRASCVDWRRDTLGDKQFLPAGTLPVSCCPYLRVQPETIELAPGTAHEIVVTLTPDQSLTQELHHGMLMLTQINEREISAAQGVQVGFLMRVQIGVHLYHIPKAGLTKTMSIDTMLAGPATENHRVSVRVNNTGKTNVESQLRVEITNLVTSEEVKLPVIPVNSLPGERIWVKAALPEKLTKGRYLIIAIVDSGSDVPLQVAELETDIP